MKKKMAVLIGIAVCAMLLTSPVLASAGYSKIYGNANEDDTLDMRDVTYIKLVIFGKKPATTFADANYDGKISMLDVGQAKLIILGKEKELTIIDSVDSIVTVKKPLRRVGTISPLNLEVLRAIKVPKDRIVFVNPSISSEGKWHYAYEIFFAEFKDVPGVSAGDAESIIALQPDAVFTVPGKRHAPPEVVKAAGIPVLTFCCTFGTSMESQECYPEEITTLGYIFDKEKEAEEFRNFYEDVMNSIEEVVEMIPEEDKPRVYEESSAGGAGTFYLFGGFCECAGGKRLFEKTSGEINPEEVVKQDPEIIVRFGTRGYAGEVASGYHLDADDTTEIAEVREEIMNREILQNVTAVKTGRVYIISEYFKCYGGGYGARRFLSIAYQAKWFHPDRFEDLDPKAIHQEYLTRFQGLDIDLNERGVFVYPEEPIRVDEK
jgi:iron complex transport system substrate-binding protein